MKSLLTVALFAVLLTAQGQLPNIVLILADDLGYGDVGCFNDESKIPTPEIDALAAAGIRFTDAHTPSSVCTPTRYGILTGRYAWRTRLKKSVLWPWDPPLLEDDRITLPELLKTRGYSTACIGKWHLGWDWPVQPTGYISDVFSGHTLDNKRRLEFQARIDFKRPIRSGPITHGFDYYFGDDVPNFPPYTYIKNDRVVLQPTGPKPKGLFGSPGPAAPEWDLAAVLPELALRSSVWIQQAAKKRKTPFFLYVPLTAPHTPIAPRKPHLGKSKAGLYGDFVCEVDWVVGEIVQSLRRTGELANTLLIFTSDNGSPQRNGKNFSGPTGSVKKQYGHDPSRPWRGMKADAWEGGHRVPFIAHWPRCITSAQVSANPVVLTDLYRTIANITKVTVPENAGEDSFDFTAHLLGAKDVLQPHRDHMVHHSHKGLFAIRIGSWKLIEGRTSGGFTRFKPPADAPAGQLYDLSKDPREAKNVYAQNPKIVKRLHTRLQGIKDAGRSNQN